MNPFRAIARKVIPYNVRLFIWGIIPKTEIYYIYKIIQKRPFTDVRPVDRKFRICKVSEYPADSIKKAYSSREFNYFEKNVLPRLSDPRWVGFAVENIENKELAYISWIVRSNVGFIDDLGIRMNPNQCFLRDAFCVPEYRGMGLNTRMDEERINYCISDGADEILFQIGDKVHPEQNILRRYKMFVKSPEGEDKGIDLVLLQRNRILIIPRLGIHRDMISFLKNPFKKY